MVDGEPIAPGAGDKHHWRQAWRGQRQHRFDFASATTGDRGTCRHWKQRGWYVHRGTSAIEARHDHFHVGDGVLADVRPGGEDQALELDLDLSGGTHFGGCFTDVPWEASTVDTPNLPGKSGEAGGYADHRIGVDQPVTFGRRDCGEPGYGQGRDGNGGRQDLLRVRHHGVFLSSGTGRRVMCKCVYERDARRDCGRAQSLRGARSYNEVMRHPARLDLLSDDALLTAVALDTRDAAAVFVRRFQRRVYGLAVTVTGDVSLADDIAQITFERAWRHAGTYDARRASVTTWLLTITRNLAIDAMRVRRSVPLDPEAVSQLLPPSPGVDPEQAAVDRDQLGRLGVELATLPNEQRRAVLLATVACRTALEIAEIEGVPLGTAKTRIRSGLRRLRAAVVEVPS